MTSTINIMTQNSILTNFGMDFLNEIVNLEFQKIQKASYLTKDTRKNSTIKA